MLRVSYDNAEALSSIAAMAGRAADLLTPLGRFGEYHVRKTQRILDSGSRGIRTRSRPGLATSLTWRADPPNAIAEGSNLVYAASQQFGPQGGVYQSSRPGGYLAIPCLDGLTAAGRPVYKSPRDVVGGFFFRGAQGGLFFGVKLGTTKKGKAKTRRKWSAMVGAIAGKMAESVKVLFALRKSVVGTDWMYCTFDEDDRPVWDEICGRWLSEGK